jgi:hypothetical protein
MIDKDEYWRLAEYPTLSDARQWSYRAEEMRALAEDMRDRHCKEMAFRIAKGYDRLAHHAEERAEIAGS